MRPDRAAYRSIERAVGGRRNALAAAMVLACLLLGGGGTSNPGMEFVLELVLPLLIVLAVWWPGRPARNTAPRISRAALVVTALALLMPIAQLIPLPAALWHTLPGRQPEIAALTLIGQANRWMPFTMTPATTFASFLAIIAELAVFISVARIDIAGRRTLCRIIAGVALVSIVLGCLQLTQAGGLTWSLYEDANFGWLFGFQANRNAETDILQIGILALAAILAGKVQQRDHVRASTLAVLVAAMLALALGAVLTGSRTGMALLPLTYLFVIWIMWPVIARRLSRAAWLVILIPPAACLILLPTEQVQHALSRFDGVGDGRWDIWHDTITAIRSVWPLGGGIGSFPVLYDAAQSIERLKPLRDIRAHNDWLEWVMETGVPGLLVLAATSVIILSCNIRALRLALSRGADPDMRATVIFATGTLLHLGIHALFDYPMRSMALAALVGTSVAMLMPAKAAPHAPE
ncbi:O-antigen ligase family protein [Novosphingobium sp.]|uniref:O-antigen ligase family protein n=1 Tax=Novosphingobium sp. TaxID=1874826 RepID=UPI003B52D085